MEGSPHSLLSVFGSQVALLSLKINYILSISYFAKHLRNLLSYSGVPAKAAGKTHGMHCYTLHMLYTALGCATAGSQALCLRNGVKQRTWMPTHGVLEKVEPDRTWVQVKDIETYRPKHGPTSSPRK